MQTLAATLPNLLSSDNSIRRSAEESLDSLRSDASSFLLALAQLSSSLPEPQLRQLALVMFRRSLSKEYWIAVHPDVQEEIKGCLLGYLKAEATPAVKKSVANAVSKLASIVSACGTWNELMPFVFTMCVTDGERQIGLELIHSLCEALPENALCPILPQISLIISGSLSAPMNLRVRASAVHAFCGVVSHIDENRKSDKETLQPILGSCLQTLADCLQEGSQLAHEVLSDLIDFVASNAALLRNYFEQTLAASLSTCSNGSVDSEIRFRCLELFLSLCESKPTIARKIPQLMDRAIPILLEMMSAEEIDINDWVANEGDREEDDDDTPSIRFGEEALERVLSSIGANRVIPCTMSLLPPMLQSPSWIRRCAALRAIGVVVSGADKALSGHLKTIVAWCVASMQDAHFCVQHAAVGAIAALCTCFGPDVQREFHADIVPTLIRLLDASCQPRLRSRAAKCVVDFSSECGDDEVPMMEHYSELWMTALLALLSSGTAKQQQAVIPAISSLAAALQDRFSRFYSQLLPLCLQMLASPAAEARPLKGPTMECISCMADAVGDEMFTRDAAQVMDLLMPVEMDIASDDPNTHYLLQAACRIAQCIKGNFLPYLPRILPLVFSLAELDPKLQMRESDDDDDDDESAVVQIKGMGRMRVSINIKALEDKALGVRTLGTLAAALEHDFLPHLDRTAQLLLPCINFKLSEAVRSAAVDHVESLLAVAKAAVTRGLVAAKVMEGMWNQIFPLFIQAAMVEPDPEAQANLYEQIAESLNRIGGSCLTDEQKLQLCQVIKPVFDDLHKGNEKGRAEEDEDEDSDEVLNQIVELLSTCVKLHGASWVPAMQATLLPQVGRMLEARAADLHKQSALHILVDLVEFGGQAAAPLVGNVALACLHHSQSENATIRRAACYGLGVCFQHGGAAVDPLVPQALPILHAVVSRARGADEEDDCDFEPARANAADAVGRVCRYHPAQVDLAAILPAWAAWLPLPADVECNATAADFLASLLETRDDPALAPLLPALLQAAARTAQLPATPPALRARLQAAAA